MRNLLVLHSLRACPLCSDNEQIDEKVTELREKLLANEQKLWAERQAREKAEVAKEQAEKDAMVSKMVLESIRFSDDNQQSKSAKKRNRRMSICPGELDRDLQHGQKSVFRVGKRSQDDLVDARRSRICTQWYL